jgi:hypothetical protein
LFVSSCYFSFFLLDREERFHGSTPPPACLVYPTHCAHRHPSFRGNKHSSLRRLSACVFHSICLCACPLDETKRPMYCRHEGDRRLRDRTVSKLEATVVAAYLKLSAFRKSSQCSFWQPAKVIEHAVQPPWLSFYTIVVSPPRRLLVCLLRSRFYRWKP